MNNKFSTIVYAAVQKSVFDFNISTGMDVLYLPVDDHLN